MTPTLNGPQPGEEDQTSATAVQRHILENSIGMRDSLNANLLAIYKQAYANYVLGMQSGGFVPDERRHAPKPPFAWELAPANEDGYIFYQISTTKLVADPASYPDSYYAASNSQANTVPNMIMIGKRNQNSSWFTAIKGDTFPSGLKTPPETSADGVFGIFEKFGAPVGPGWYLLVTQM